MSDLYDLDDCPIDFCRECGMTVVWCLYGSEWRWLHERRPEHEHDARAPLPTVEFDT